MGMTYGYKAGDLPVTEDISGRLLRLPLFYDITDQEQEYVVERIREYLEGAEGRFIEPTLSGTASTVAAREGLVPSGTGSGDVAKLGL